MGAEKFRGKYRIESNRLKNYDYSQNGAYFITIVTKNRNHFFGNITDKKMALSETGEIVQKYWDEIPQHFSFIHLDEMVVMPNHIHGILWIDGDGGGGDGGGGDGDVGVNDVGGGVDDVGVGVETLHATSLSSTQSIQSPPSQSQNQKMAKISPKRGSLATVIRSFKSAVTRESRNILPQFAWQPNFHDHIIRNQNELNRIRKYIASNPKKWESDRNS